MQLFGLNLITKKAKMFVRKGFTLAEVLITLGIIGVVASLTIPSLFKNTNDAELNTAWKKEYSVLTSAISLVMNDNSGNIKGVFPDTTGDTFLNALKTKLHVVKYCAATTAKGNCWVADSGVKNLAGGSPDTFDMGDNAALVLADGAFVTINWPNGANCDRDVAYKKDCGWLLVDVNGFKKPNTQGKDIFWLYVGEDKSWPAGTQNDYMYANLSNHGCDLTNDTALQGWGCSAFVILGQTH